MLKILLIGLCASLCASALIMGNKTLTAYWLLVGVYWIINIMEATN